MHLRPSNAIAGGYSGSVSIDGYTQAGAHANSSAAVTEGRGNGSVPATNNAVINLPAEWRRRASWGICGLGWRARNSGLWISPICGPAIRIKGKTAKHDLVSGDLWGFRRQGLWPRTRLASWQRAARDRSPSAALGQAEENVISANRGDGVDILAVWRQRFR